MRVVAALGGNALARRGEEISTEVQRRNLRAAAAVLAPLTRAHELVLTFGDGPQIGHLLLESESDQSAHPSPLDVIGAEAVGMIGYLLEQSLLQCDPGLRIVTLVTQTVVAEDDPHSLRHRGRSARCTTVRRPRSSPRRGDSRWHATAGGGAGSCLPLSLSGCSRPKLSASLVDRGFLVVASGGGGMPVLLDSRGRPSGIEAVVDKDLAAVVLARTVNAERLLLLTDVDGVYDGFGTPSAHRLGTLSPREARMLAESGALGRGSMLPKVEAAARFAEHGGIAVIAALSDAAEALAGRAGTTVAVWPTSAPG